MKQYITTIQKDKKGLYLVIPKILLRKLKWKVGDILEWKFDNLKIMLVKVN